MMKFRFCIAIIGCLLIVSSCASRKKTVAPPATSFEWLTANLNIQTEGNGLSLGDLTGQLRMKKDSLVWLNVTAPMGVEMLRAKVSNDSIWILNRLDKSYLAEPLDAVSAQLGMPISLPWVQTLLLDNSEGIPPVEKQTVQLKAFVFGNTSAKIRYNNIRLDEATTFPLKITDKMERFRLPTNR